MPALDELAEGELVDESFVGGVDGGLDSLVVVGAWAGSAFDGVGDGSVEGDLGFLPASAIDGGVADGSVPDVAVGSSWWSGAEGGDGDPVGVVDRSSRDSLLGEDSGASFGEVVEGAAGVARNLGGIGVEEGGEVSAALLVERLGEGLGGAAGQVAEGLGGFRSAAR